jgi:hypothetical protein
LTLMNQPQRRSKTGIFGLHRAIGSDSPASRMTFNAVRRNSIGQNAS